MNSRQWTFEGLPFRILLEQAGRDRLPFPLQFRPSADSAADYDRQRDDAAHVIDAVMDEDLRAAVHTIVEPRVRVEVVGHVRSGRMEHRKVRAHAAIGYDFAVVLTQQPGIDDRSGGTIRMECVDPFRGVTNALEVLPRVAGGASPRIEVDQPRLSVDEQDSPLHQSVPRTSGEERYKRLFSRAPSSAGEILVCAGPAPDSRLTEGTTGIQWVDFEDDGRYMIRHTSIISVIGASVSDLAAEVRGLVEKAAVG